MSSGSQNSTSPNLTNFRTCSGPIGRHGHLLERFSARNEAAMSPLGLALSSTMTRSLVGEAFIGPATEKSSAEPHDQGQSSQQCNFSMSDTDADACVFITTSGVRDDVPGGVRPG